MLTYVEDISLFKSPAQTLVNTVNTAGVMGKGIAAEFKRLYPKMYKQYRKICQEGKLEIGKLFIYRTPNKIIVNFPTKKHWKEKSRVEYLELGLRKFVDYYSDYGISSVSFPQLGCGHGELDWVCQVKPVIEKHLNDLPIPVYIHLYPRPADFIPERLDPEYEKQVLTERQIISTKRLWEDLKEKLSEQHREGYGGELFGHSIEIDDDAITFTYMGGTPRIYRDDIEDLWNILRVRGTISEKDLPNRITNLIATNWLFEVLKKLDYIKEVKLKSPSEPFFLGLRYDPPPEQNQDKKDEIVI